MSGCRGLMAKHWWLKPKVVQLPVAVTGLFTFLYFGLITSKFLYTPYSSTPCFVGGVMIRFNQLPFAHSCLPCKLNSISPCYKTSLDRCTESMSVEGMCVTTLLTRCYALWAQVTNTGVPMPTCLTSDLPQSYHSPSYVSKFWSY